MKCIKCKSKNTRVTVTTQRSTHTIRYCRCLDCKFKFKTEERYVKYDSPKQLAQRNAKLNVDKVREIRANKQKLTNFELSFKYDVELSTIVAIKSRKTWKYVD